MTKKTEGAVSDSDQRAAAAGGLLLLMLISIQMP